MPKSVLLLGRIWGAKPPRMHHLNKDHQAWYWIRVKNISLLVEFRLQNPAEPQSRRGTPVLPFRSAWKNLSLFEMEETYIASLAIQDSSPFSPLPLQLPLPSPHEISSLLSFLSLLICHSISGKRLFFICYTQSVPRSSCTRQENEHGWCAFCSCSFLTYSAAALLLTALTDDYNYSLNHSV